jgi:hypothetical protein
MLIDVNKKYDINGKTTIFDAVPITNAFSLGQVLPNLIEPPVIIKTKGKIIIPNVSDFQRKRVL